MSKSEEFLREDGLTMRDLLMRSTDGIRTVMYGCVDDIYNNMNDHDKVFDKIINIYKRLTLCFDNDRILDNESMRKLNTMVIEYIGDLERLKCSILAFFHVYSLQYLYSLERLNEKKKISPSDN